MTQKETPWEYSEEDTDFASFRRNKNEEFV